YDFLTGSMQDDIFKHLDELLAKSLNDSSLLSKSLDNVDEKWKKREEALNVFKKIIECVNDQSLEIRILACKKLACLAHPEAAETLKKALKEKDKRLRDAAGRALAASVRESAVGPLLDIYDDERSLVPEKWSECLYTADKNWTSRDEVFKKVDSLLAVMTTEVSAEKRNDIALRLILILKNYNGVVLYEKYRERFSAVSKYFVTRLAAGGDEQKMAFHFIWQTNPIAYHEVAMLAESGNAKLREAASQVFEGGPVESDAGSFPYDDNDRIRCLYLKKDPAGLEKYGEKAIRFLYMLAEEERLYEKCYDVLDRLGGSPIQRKALKYILFGIKAAPEYIFEKLIVRNAFLLKIKKDLTACFSGLNLKTVNEYGGFEKLGAEYFNEKTAVLDKKAILGTLVKIDKIRALDMLAWRLGSSDKAEALLAMDGLDFIGRLYNYRPLVNMLETKDEKIRFRAAALLLKLGFRPFRLKDKKLFDEALQAIEKKAEANEGGKKK
ncbi:MAG TPA: HEAT repeat domain-containing protein, partial [Candidatus Wallbacteria bacterium]|nr:HEAT repeat domain-containing protein [Candidatus Wallbacteria bacterium]